MKKLFALAALSCLSLSSASLTQAERDRLLAELKKSAAVFLKSLEGVSEAQWKFKPAPDRWSIAECAEHIVTSDQMMLTFVSQQLSRMPPPSTPPNKRTDDAVLKSYTDRTTKVKTAEFLEPRNRIATRAEAIQAFEKGRAAVAEFARTTTDDLRSRGFDSPAGYSDGYQFLLSLSAHGERHAMQIDEVKAHPNYPKQ